MLRQTLEQKLQQRLSPAQIQVIKMLEIPTLEMEERIRQELEENPALEEGRDEADKEDNFEEDNFEEDDLNDDLNDDAGKDEIDLEEYMSDDDIPDYRLRTNNVSKDDKREDIPFSIGTTFHDYLREQLGWQKLTEHERQLGEYVIGNIDDGGYLSRSVEAIVDDIVFYAGIVTTEEEVSKIVSVVQKFDPAGVGAFTLQECLRLQLERKSGNPTVALALEVVNNYFEEFSRKHYEKIQKALDIDEDELRDVISEITRLNPKPGNAWGGDLMEKSMSVIVPDFILEREDDKFVVHLNNSNIPELRVNRTYNELFRKYQDNKSAREDKKLKDAVMFAKQKVDSARWFIDAIKQRQETLLTTMQAIVNYQYEFFLEGDDVYLKPMILKDIADMTGYDISTISRVSNSKYVQTEFGVYPIKYFFSESMTTDSGEEVSTREIKKILQECVDQEDKSKPLNDEALAALLKTKGYNIARRTVAKYREQLNIPVSRLRKEL
ncbi:MAG: RNA polymerase sigma-54 factor [Bacteroidetes bacterium ADurb.Bin174]|jgi:RNA polymerase sigma-54 factor|nr:MAG: RNA polymerase sigma-54 factor [Bacteroidetes bacterium ADurb.Bin174]